MLTLTKSSDTKTRRYTVSLQIIRVYEVEVEADNEELAYDAINMMDTAEIEERGYCGDTNVDYIEIIASTDPEFDQE